MNKCWQIYSNQRICSFNLNLWMWSTFLAIVIWKFSHLRVKSSFLLFNHINYLLPIGRSTFLRYQPDYLLFNILMNLKQFLFGTQEKSIEIWFCFAKNGAKKTSNDESSTVIMSYSQTLLFMADSVRWCIGYLLKYHCTQCSFI